jgi:ABC-type lipoprotein release transport system permease subunit
VSIGTNRLLQSELWGTTPTDPMTFVAAILLTLAIGAIACLVPARRAVRIEPMVALRHE